MALWSFINQGREVVVLRRDTRGSCERGRGEARYLADLVAAVMGRAAACEQVVTPGGVFTKQQGPKGWV